MGRLLGKKKQNKKKFVKGSLTEPSIIKLTFKEFHIIRIGLRATSVCVSITWETLLGFGLHVSHANVCHVN